MLEWLLISWLYGAGLIIFIGEMKPAHTLGLFFCLLWPLVVVGAGAILIWKGIVK